MLTSSAMASTMASGEASRERGCAGAAAGTAGARDSGEAVSKELPRPDAESMAVAGEEPVSMSRGNGAACMLWQNERLSRQSSTESHLDWVATKGKGGGSALRSLNERRDGETEMNRKMRAVGGEPGRLIRGPTRWQSRDLVCSSASGTVSHRLCGEKERSYCKKERWRPLCRLDWAKLGQLEELWRRGQRKELNDV